MPGQQLAAHFWRRQFHSCLILLLAGALHPCLLVYAPIVFSLLFAEFALVVCYWYRPGQHHSAQQATGSNSSSVTLMARSRCQMQPAHARQPSVHGLNHFNQSLLK
jgi:hypothetical protein